MPPAHIALALLVAVIWGMNFAAMKIGLESFPPLLLTGLRFLLAAVPVLWLSRPVVPWPLMLALILLAGYPIFRNVARAALRREVTSHTLMTVGMIAAILVGEWAAAAVVVLFFGVGA